jgi:putative ABC transport system permease protein
MSVFERTQEIGVMKALGASKFDIFKIIWAETLIVCVIGGLAGNILALIGGHAVEYIIKQILPYTPRGRLVLIEPLTMLIAFGGAIVMGFVAGIYPALRASLMRPVEAIRRGE